MSTGQTDHEKRLLDQYSGGSHTYSTKPGQTKRRSHVTRHQRSELKKSFNI